jgi:hypothetical protein
MVRSRSVGSISILLHQALMGVPIRGLTLVEDKYLTWKCIKSSTIVLERFLLWQREARRELEEEMTLVLINANLLSSEHPSIKNFQSWTSGVTEYVACFK